MLTTYRDLQKHFETTDPARLWTLDDLANSVPAFDFLYDQAELVPKGQQNAERDILHELFHRRGFCIARIINADHLEDDQLRRASDRLAAKLGPLHPQNKAGDLNYRVENIDEQSARTFRFSKSRFDSTFHTDCAYRDKVPTIVTLFCIHPAAEGGVSQVSSVYASLRNLDAEAPEAVQELLARFHFDRRGTEQKGEAPTAMYPILSLACDALFIRYLRPYIEIGQENAGQCLTDQQVASFDALDRHSASSDLVLNIKLKRGECLVANNIWVFHNRTEFKDGPDAPNRLIMRHWIG